MSNYQLRSWGITLAALFIASISFSQSPADSLTAEQVAYLKGIAEINATKSGRNAVHF